MDYLTNIHLVFIYNMQSFCFIQIQLKLSNKQGSYLFLICQKCYYFLSTCNQRIMLQYYNNNNNFYCSYIQWVWQKHTQTLLSSNNNKHCKSNIFLSGEKTFLYNIYYLPSNEADFITCILLGYKSQLLKSTITLHVYNNTLGCDVYYLIKHDVR